MAIFASNGNYLLGVTTQGTVFKADLAARKVELIEGTTLKAASLTVSPSGTTLYVAGDGLTVVDVDHMRVTSKLTTEPDLLEVAASPDDHTVVLRNWHNIELFNITGAESGKPAASVIVDPVPNGASISSTSRLAFAADGSSLFYIRASGTGSELISLSTNDLHIEARSTIGAYPNAIAIMPERGWVLVTAGVVGQEQFEAIDMKTQAVIFKEALAGSSSSYARTSDGCSSNGR